jgi:hypothetical protein
LGLASAFVLGKEAVDGGLEIVEGSEKAALETSGSSCEWQHSGAEDRVSDMRRYVRPAAL